ncbi:hypothetical protein EMPS_02844 [Entomortierella parvispora]|uniref:Cytochrome P450 n=1 Tax=Entomortierella parvispora TaxID=205924 RepID=A0A9P3LUB6_9FUNG|nr:hypothetical protein EMPS_02844 [Entomortierella parvispora]
MLGLVSNSPGLAASDALKAAIPIGIGLASAAYLTMKAVAGDGFGSDKSIPIASLRAGDSTHDKEYYEDQDAFIDRCQSENGDVFGIYLMNKNQIVVSGPMVREVFMNEDFSAGDSIDELTSMRSYFRSMTKSNADLDNRTIHELVRDNITPYLPRYTARIVLQLEKNLDIEMAKYEATCRKEDGRILVEKPITILQEMVANAMATVFVGPEIAKDRHVIETFIHAAADFGKVLGSGEARRHSAWKSFLRRTEHRIMNPLHKHIRVLVDASTPVVLERRRLEKEAEAQGRVYERPDDILQKLLDSFDKYHFVDLEDVCGHLMILILASVHTTTDTSTNLLFYLAAYPQYIQTLYEEQKEVLDQIQKEREAQRLELLAKGEPIGDDLDPSEDRFLTAAAIKRMAHMDSFVREVFRNRIDRLTLGHKARKDITLSNGMVISKGVTAIINMKSAHQSPSQGEDVTEFRPWRFVGKSKAATKAAADFLPFGMGKHACPGRFLAIQELKTIGVLMLSRYSMLEIQDPSKTTKILRSRIGTPTISGLIFTERK